MRMEAPTEHRRMHNPPSEVDFLSAGSRYVRCMRGGRTRRRCFCRSRLALNRQDSWTIESVRLRKRPRPPAMMKRDTLPPPRGEGSRGADPSPPPALPRPRAVLGVCRRPPDSRPSQGGAGCHVLSPLLELPSRHGWRGPRAGAPPPQLSAEAGGGRSPPASPPATAGGGGAVRPNPAPLQLRLGEAPPPALPVSHPWPCGRPHPIPRLPSRHSGTLGRAGAPPAPAAHPPATACDGAVRANHPRQLPSLRDTFDSAAVRVQHFVALFNWLRHSTSHHGREHGENVSLRRMD